MKPFNTAGVALVALGLACAAQAEPTAPAAPPAPPSEAEPLAPAAKPAEKKDSKGLAAETAEAESNRMRVEFAEGKRVVTAYYPKSQARIRVSAVTRFDAEIARPREHFLVELTGAAIVDPLVLDADNEPSRHAVIAILERFDSEVEKSKGLKDSMAKRKVAVADELSREETRLLDLQSAESPDAAAVAKSKARIEELKEASDLAEDLGKLTKISGPIGTAKLNLDRPAYEFIATMEPSKSLYTLKAGYSFQVSSTDVKFYLDLLKQTQELKARLLAHEARQLKLKEEINQLFKSKKS